MTRPRNAAALALVALLATGSAIALATGPAVAQTATPSSTDSTETAPATTDPLLPAEFSMTIPGLGDIALALDPSTGEILTVTVTPIEGVTAADPVPVHNGIRLEFTLADGTIRAMVVEIEFDDDGIEIEIEPADDGDDSDDGDERGEHRNGPPPVAERGRSAEHRNDDNEHSRGKHNGTSTTMDRSRNDDDESENDDEPVAEERDDQSSRRSGR